MNKQVKKELFIETIRELSICFLIAFIVIAISI